MRPYFAIIKDSFRAAMASRVLYVLLVLITLLLLALAPLHMRETLDWQLNRDFNVPNPELVMRQIVNNKETTPANRVWELLPDGIKTRMQNVIEKADEEGANDDPGQSIEEIFLQQEMIEDLNKIIENPDFYRAEDWKEKILPVEAQDLVEAGVEKLSPVRSKRLNRLLLSSILPAIDQGNATALLFKYAMWEFPAPLSMTQQQFAQTMTTQLPWYFEKLVLSVGLLIAVIVTANMIPETFEPGSLNLLLSKPISRWGLFVAKFAGGCVFIALCAAYLFIGIWLWLGLAMGVWDRAILFSVPLYIVVFTIYFSVSAVVGLLWRSAIVSVIMTLMFWACCWTIGTVFYRFDTKMQNSELINILPAGENEYASDVLHQFLTWDAANKEWDPVLTAGLGAEGKIQFGMNSFFFPLREMPVFPGITNHLAPIYDDQSALIYSSRYELGRSLTSGTKKMFVAKAEGKLKFKEVGNFPRDTVKMFKSKNGIIAVTSAGQFHQLDSADLASRLENAPLADASLPKPRKPTPGKSVVISKSAKPDQGVADELTEANEENPSTESQLWRSVGPNSSLSVRSSHHVGYNAKRDEIVVYRRGVLKVFKFEKDKYVLHATQTLSLEFDKGMTSRLAYEGDTILVAFGNGKVISIDAETLEEKNEYQPEKRSAIEFVSASENGRFFAVLYRNGNLWMLDTQDEAKMRKASVTGQGKICTCTFSADDSLIVAYDTDQVARYDLSNNSIEERYTPAGGFVEKVYRYGLRPFYVICPKPGEFYKVVTHLSSSGDTESNSNVDLNKTLQASDPWSPLWSGLAFMAAMLSLGCLIFQFKEY